MKRTLKIIACYWATIAAVILMAAFVATVMRVVEIYAPNPNVPFLSASSAVRG